MVLCLCMTISLLPISAAAAVPEAPTGLSIKIGTPFHQTLPVLTWNKVPGASSYNIYCTDGSGEHKIGGTANNYFTPDRSGSATISKYSVAACSADGEGAKSDLNRNTVITSNSGSTINAIHNSAQLGEDTYQLYTFTGLPANTSVWLEYGIMENGDYRPKMSTRSRPTATVCWLFLISSSRAEAF